MPSVSDHPAQHVAGPTARLPEPGEGGYGRGPVWAALRTLAPPGGSTPWTSFSALPGWRRKQQIKKTKGGGGDGQLSPWFHSVTVSFRSQKSVGSMVAGLAP
jgi:hypothetical protein